MILLISLSTNVGLLVTILIYFLRHPSITIVCSFGVLFSHYIADVWCETMSRRGGKR